MEFKDSLKKIRQEKHLSQQALSDLVGVRQYVIASWETGRSEPSIKDIIKLQSVLNVPLEYLLGIIDELPKSYELMKYYDNLDSAKQDKLLNITKEIFEILK